MRLRRYAVVETAINASGMALNYALTCSVDAARCVFDLAGNVPESATARWPRERLAITITIATGDPKPLTVKPTTSIARVSAVLLDVADEMRRRRPADALPRLRSLRS